MVAARAGMEPMNGPRSLHNEALSALPRPSWLVSESLLEHTWTVRFDDADEKRRASRRIYFDVVLAPGGVLSTDPSLEHDLLTAKMLVYHSLRPGFAGGITSSVAYAPTIAREYFAFVRWRLSRGIRSNADLSREWMDEYFAAIRERGPQGLLPLKERAVALVARYEELGLKFQTRDNSFDTSPLGMLRPLAREIGVDHPGSLNQEAREFLLEAFRARGIATKEGGREDLRPGMRARRDSDDDGWTASRLLVLLRPLELLFRFRRHLHHDPIAFDPFENGSVSQISKALATRELGRTPTVPAAQACHLINEALLWVLELSPDLMSLLEQFNDALEGVTHPSQRLRKAGRVFRHFQPNALPADHRVWGNRSLAWARNLFVDLLPGACVVVIAAFSARRHEEIDSLRAGAVHSVGQDFWLDTWISKTLRSVDKIPIPASVASAVAILEKLSLMQRRVSRDPWILQIRFPGSNRKTRLPKALTAFAEYSNVPTLPNGTHWWFTPHQFRRFFGITYYHRFRFPHLAALSQFYRHFDPDMTRTYISEAVLGGFFKLEEERNTHETMAERTARLRAGVRYDDFLTEARNFRIERYHGIIRGDERASGFGGDTLTQELRALEADVRNQLEIVSHRESESALNKALEAFAAGTRLEPNPLGHGYCRCRSTPADLKVANCLRQEDAQLNPVEFAVAPDPAQAGDSVCSACPHNVQLPENEPYWRSLYAYEEGRRGCAMGPLLAALSEARSDMAAAHIKRCFE